MTEAYKKHVIEKSVIYRRNEGELKEFERQVNSAAAELCLNDVKLLDNRGKLLQLARKKVADDGYIFKKAHSRSKMYGIPQDESVPKRPKYSQDMRERRIEAIGDELRDIVRIVQFKEKRLMQAEAAKKYAMCEQLTIEIKELRDKKRELELEKAQFVKKGKRAMRRRVRESDFDAESSDIDDNCPSTSSRSATPAAQSTSLLPSLSTPSSPEFVCTPKGGTPTASVSDSHF